MSWRAATAICVITGIMLINAGCMPRHDSNIIEEIAPVIFWSIDQGQDGMLKISTLVPPLSKEEKKLFTLNVNLLNQGKKAFNRSYYRELKNGQMRMLFISEQVARKGIRPIIDTILADPEIPMRLYLAVYKGDLLKYLENQLKKEPLTDYFLYRTLKHYETRSEGEITVVNLHQFMRRLYSPLADPVIPVYQADPNQFTYVTTGLFRNDKLVSFLSRNEEQVFQLLSHHRSLQELSLPELSVNVSDVHAKPAWKVDRHSWSAKIEVEIRCRIEEYHGSKDLTDPSQVNELNRIIGQFMEKQTESLIKKMQEMNVDPFDIGSLTTGPFENKMGAKAWEQQWPQMKFEVEYRTFMEPLTNALSGS